MNRVKKPEEKTRMYCYIIAWLLLVTVCTALFASHKAGEYRGQQSMIKIMNANVLLSEGVKEAVMFLIGFLIFEGARKGLNMAMAAWNMRKAKESANAINEIQRIARGTRKKSPFPLPHQQEIPKRVGTNQQSSSPRSHKKVQKKQLAIIPVDR